MNRENFTYIVTHIASMGLSALLPVLAGLGCSSSCGGRNESSDALRSVPVPLEVAPALPGAAALPAGEAAAVRQSYSLSPDGQFTFHRSVEEEVGSIGAGFTSLGRESAARLGLEPYSGVLILTVRSGGPAGRAGLMPDDVIVSFGGHPVSSPEGLGHLIETGIPGAPVDVAFKRRGEETTGKLILGTETRIADGRGMQQNLPVRDDLDRTGLRLAELTPEARAIILGPAQPRPGLLVVEVLQGGPGFFADLRVKDYLVGAGGERLEGLDDYARLVGTLAPGDEVLFTVVRGDSTLEVPIEVVEDARAESGVNLLNIVKWGSEPDGKRLGLIFDLLFTYRSSYCVKKADSSTKNVTHTYWGTTLNLIMWRSETGGRKELRLLWFFPISWGGD
ncbi:MAG: PDZ domain-containing protein [Planctomycetes bacterium]|nr:PDZ domain-containing protein [Planctomycetota bacterium]